MAYDNLLDTESDKKGSQVADYFQGFFHQLIENPVNGVTQIINKTVGAEIPKLEIAGEPERKSVGAIAGSVTGGVINYMLLSKVANPMLGNLGGEGLRGQALRAGIVGGIYSGVFMPSPDNTENFLGDRVTTAMVGAATFAAMSAASFKIEQSGHFRVPELRSLVEHMKVGGASGAVGGVVHSEANALFKKGEFLPSMSELLTDTLSFAGFGAGMGAMSWAGHKMSSLKEGEFYSKIPTNDGAENGRIKYTMNKNNEVIRMQADIPNGENGRIGWLSEKMSNGVFRNQGIQVVDGKLKITPDMEVPQLRGIELTKEGIKFATGDGTVKELKSDGRFEKDRPNKIADQEARDAKYKAEMAKYDSSEYVDIYGKKTVHFEAAKGPDGKPLGSNNMYIGVEKTGMTKELSIHSGDKFYTVKGDGNNQWKIVEHLSGNGAVSKEYTWKGDIKVVSNPQKPEKIGSIEILPEGAKTPIVLSKQGLDYSGVDKAFFNSAKFSDYYKGDGYYRVDNEGNIFLRLRGAAAEQPVKAGDQLTFKYDVGDRYPVWKEVQARWAKSLDGARTLLNDRPLLPNTITNLEVFNPGY